MQIARGWYQCLPGLAPKYSSVECYINAYIDVGGDQGESVTGDNKEYPMKEAITEEHSKDCLALLAKANTCGKLFSVNIAGHLTANDIFLATKETMQEKEKKRLTTEKTRRVTMTKVEEKAKGILETKGVDGTR